MNVLSLFAGIGGLESGLERAGMTVVGQVELDPWCRSVLAKHWPEVPRHDDVRTAPDWWRSAVRPAVDLVCGGFPCQPFADSGLQQGIADDRWGWPWMLDVVRAVRPRFVVVENVPGLLRDRDAFGLVLGGLAEFGFDAEWSLLSACAVGAPHTRERLFLVAYTDGGIRSTGLGAGTGWALPLGHGGTCPSADQDVWGVAPTPSVRGVADGVSAELDGARVKALGNAVVPAVAEHIGRLIMAGVAA